MRRSSPFIYRSLKERRRRGPPDREERVATDAPVATRCGGGAILGVDLVGHERSKPDRVTVSYGLRNLLPGALKRQCFLAGT